MARSRLSKPPSRDATLEKLIQLLIRPSLRFRIEKDTWNQEQEGDAAEVEANLPAPSSSLVRQKQRGRC